MTIKQNLLLALAAAVAAAAHALPSVTGATFTQRQNTRTVDIAYTLTGEPAIITFSVETNGVPLPDSAVTRLSGDVAILVQPGPRHIVWNAGGDWPEHAVTNARAHITAWHTSAPPPYAVVDLAGGVASNIWPVTYHPSAEALPDGGLTNDIYRTTRLVLRRIRTQAPFPENGALQPGSPAYSLGRNADNETLHDVRLTRDFYAGIYEVTQAQYYQIMSDAPQAGGGGWPSAWSHPGHRQTRPVEQVSYYTLRENPASTHDPAVDWPLNSAVNPASFFGRLRAKTGIPTFDLPTEAQWEYAARAGATGALTDGSPNITNITADARLDRLGRYAYNGALLWDAANSKWDLPNTVLGVPQSAITTNNATAAVGSYAPNAWGLYDVHGNVFEWVLDRYAVNYATPSSQTDPPGPEVGELVDGVPQRVLRSGAHNLQASSVRLPARTPRAPTWRAHNTGFRVVWTLPEF
jgi:formylglycine-generating enzyme required for sulfatase activity